MAAKISLSIGNRWSSVTKLSSTLTYSPAKIKENKNKNKSFHKLNIITLFLVPIYNLYFCFFLCTFIFIGIILIITTATTIYCVFDIHMKLQTRT